MKTTKRKSPIKPLPEKGSSFIALPSQEIRTDDGANTSSTDADFAATVAPFLLSQYGSFSESDAIALSRGQDLSPILVKASFSKWVAQLCRDGKLERVPTIYDEAVFKVV